MVTLVIFLDQIMGAKLSVYTRLLIFKSHVSLFLWLEYEFFHIASLSSGVEVLGTS